MPRALTFTVPMTAHSTVCLTPSVPVPGFACLAHISPAGAALQCQVQLSQHCAPSSTTRGAPEEPLPCSFPWSQPQSTFKVSLSFTYHSPVISQCIGSTPISSSSLPRIAPEFGPPQQGYYRAPSISQPNASPVLQPSSSDPPNLQLWAGRIALTKTG